MTTVTEKRPQPKFHDTTFGLMLGGFDFPKDADLILVCLRTDCGAPRPIRTLLPGQIYKHEIAKLKEEYPSASELVVYALRSGERVTYPMSIFTENQRCDVSFPKLKAVLETLGFVHQTKYSGHETRFTFGQAETLFIKVKIEFDESDLDDIVVQAWRILGGGDPAGRIRTTQIYRMLEDPTI